MTLREVFMEWLRQQLGKPVLWGSKGPDFFDCSGLVTYGLKLLGGPDWRATHNTDRLWKELEPVLGPPAPGDLVFWFAPGGNEANGDVEHVAVLLDGGLVLTADGASSRIHTPEAAAEAHAIVRVRGDVNYRKRLAGFRKFPLTEGPDGKPVLVCKV